MMTHTASTIVMSTTPAITPPVKMTTSGRVGQEPAPFPTANIISPSLFKHQLLCRPAATFYDCLIDIILSKPCPMAITMHSLPGWLYSSATPPQLCNSHTPRIEHIRARTILRLHDCTCSPNTLVHFSYQRCTPNTSRDCPHRPTYRTYCTIKDTYIVVPFIYRLFIMATVCNGLGSHEELKTNILSFTVNNFLANFAK